MVGSLCIVMRFIMRNRPCGFEAEQSLLLGADWRPRKSGGSAVCKRLRPQEAFGANCDTRAEGDGYPAPKRNQFSFSCPFGLLRSSVCWLNGAHPHKEAQTTLSSPESQMQPSYLETPSQRHPGRAPRPCQGTINIVHIEN